MSQIRQPDFIIAGAPRSGTTWLYRLLEQHPGVYLPSPPQPEPKFFLVDEQYQRGLDYYSNKWFATAEPGQVLGEKSTNYLENPVVAERIQRHLPTVKLIFILREPVTRAWSNYLWSCRNGMEDEDFARALALEEEREGEVSEALRYARPHAYYSRGLYADLLEPYLARFPREAILVMRFEEISGEPQAFAEKIHHFLGLPPRPEDAVDIGVVNSAVSGTTPSLDPQTARALALRYREPNRRLAALLGNEFKQWETR